MTDFAEPHLINSYALQTMFDKGMEPWGENGG
jgi:hypothetical protein